MSFNNTSSKDRYLPILESIITNLFSFEGSLKILGFHLNSPNYFDNIHKKCINSGNSTEKKKTDIKI